MKTLGKAVCLAFTAFIFIPITVLASAGPAITNQPQSLSIVVGSNAAFTVVATGQAPLSYQWSFNKINLSNSSHIGGATNATLTVSNVTLADVGNYQVVVSNSHGSIASSNATLTVLVPAGITLQPTNQNVLLSSNVTLAAGVTGATPVSVRWYFDGSPLSDSGGISGSGTTNLTISNVQINDAGSYQLIAVNNYGSATSTVATLTVLVPAAISSQPVGVTNFFGGAASFSVSAIGTAPLSYQWYFNGTPLSDNNGISGSATALLNLARVLPANIGNYQVIVTNEYGSADSVVVTLDGTNGVFYVNINNPNPVAPYTDWSTAATNIQDAVDIAEAGGQIFVTNGVYTYGNRVTSETSYPFGFTVNSETTNCVVVTNAISISSVSGAAQTSIDGGGGKRCIYLGGGATLTGFTLTDGLAPVGPGGGVFCDSTTDSIVNCIFTENISSNEFGGGGAYEGTLTNCMLSGNWAVGGAAAWNSVLNHCMVSNNFYEAAAVIYSTLNQCLVCSNSGGGLYGGSWGGAAYCNLNACTLIGNTAVDEGGGAYDSTLSNCVLTANIAYDGGGAYGCTLYNCVISSNWFVGYATYLGGGVDDSTLYNCLLTHNAAFYGGGAEDSTLVNCTVAGNLGYVDGAGVDSCAATNSIVYYNSMYFTGSPNYGGTNFMSWCCTTPLPNNGSTDVVVGVNNLTSAPMFVNPTNQFHLLAGSPCIDAGNNAYVNSATDLDGNPRIINGTVDMGCYEYQLTPMIQVQPLSQTNTIGQTVIFSVLATGFPTLSYQWLYNGSNITGATGTTLILTNIQVTETGTYSVIVSNPLGSVASSNATLTVVYPPPVILSQPANLSIFPGSNAFFSAAVLTYSPTVYQWFTNGVPLVDGGRITGSATTNLFIANAQVSDSGNYQLIAINDSGSATSAVATLTVAFPPPAILSQPTNEAVFVGSPASFSANVFSYAPTAYQWLSNGVAMVDGGRVNGSATTSLAIANAQISDSANYQLIATSEFGSTSSVPATLTVYPVTTAVVQPAILTVPGGTNVTFTATVTGQGPFSYQWQFDGTNLPGAISSSMTLNNVLDSQSGAYSVAVSNPAGTVVSSNAMLAVVPWVTASIQPNSVISGFVPVEFSLQAGGFQTNAIYQWQLNGTNLNSSWTWTNSSQTSSFVPYMANAGAYDIVAVDGLTSLTSSIVTLSVNPLAILTQPQGQTVISGTNVTFTVYPAGEPTIMCQWMFNGAIIPGATNSSLTLTNVTPPQDGNYSVALTNGYASLLSSNAVLNVIPLMISKQPTNRITWPNGSATFAVNVLGQPPFGFDWQLNGVDVPGIWTNVLTLTNVQPSQFGTYDVIISNAWGNVISTNFSLLLSQVAVWGGMGGESNLTPGLTNIIGIAAGAYSSFDCMALASNGIAIHWPKTNINLKGTSTLAAIAGGYAGGPGAEGPPFYGLQRNGIPAEWLVDDIVEAIPGMTNAAAIPPEILGAPFALSTNGTIIVSPQLAAAIALPVPITNAVSVAEGVGFYMALKADGTVYAWGNNSSGQTNVPPGLSNVVAIAAGYEYGLALKNDGTVVSWGFSRMTNVPPGLSNVVAIAAGNIHNMALLANGTVVTWGFDTYGETNVPPGLTNVIAIAAGPTFSMALIGNGPPVMSAPLSNPTIGTNGFSFSLPSQSGRVYVLQYKNSLTDPAWTSLPLVSGNGGTIILTDPAATNQQRFYRVQRW